MVYFFLAAGMISALTSAVMQLYGADGTNGAQLAIAWGIFALVVKEQKK